MHCRIFIICCCLFLTTNTTVNAQAATISHKHYHQLEGDFYFPDGSYITGGPNDEVKGSLLFIDPLGLSRGGLFIPVDSLEFKSLPDGSNRIKFDSNKKGEVLGLWWLQDGKAPLYAQRKNKFRIEEIRVPNAGFELAGEIYRPFTNEKTALIIQVHGSGRQGRHAGPWNTFALQQGVAVLGYDKRGVGASGGNYATAGYEDLASDLLAVIAFAKKLPGIDSNRIGIHASSEGGWVASIAAAHCPNLAFMIVRAGSGLSGSDTYIYEVQNELKEKKLTEQEYYQAVRFERSIQDMAAARVSLDTVNAYIAKSRSENAWFKKAFGDYRDISAAYWVKLTQSGRIDPVVYLRSLNKLPVLWFLAEADENVPYALSKLRLQDAFAEAGNANFELVSLPNARHSFLVFSKEGVHYAPGYWNKMLTWLAERK